MRFRVLDETVSSPTLPFVTSSTTSDAEAAIIVEALNDLFGDPETASLRLALELSGIAVPDVPAYEQLAAYEKMAAEMGYPEIQ